MRFQMVWPQIQMLFLFYKFKYCIIVWFYLTLYLFLFYLKVIYSFGIKLGRINDHSTLIFEWTNP